MKNKIYIIIIAILVISNSIVLSLYLQKAKEIGGTRTDYGLPGIYNATPITLDDEEGTALNTDANGNVKIKITN